MSWNLILDLLNQEIYVYKKEILQYLLSDSFKWFFWNWYQYIQTDIFWHYHHLPLTMLCDTFEHERWDLQFNVGSERLFWKAFSGYFIYIRSFCQTATEKENQNQKKFGYYVFANQLTTYKTTPTVIWRLQIVINNNRMSNFVALVDCSLSIVVLRLKQVQ